VKRKRGRPSNYKPEYARQVTHLCRLGATDAEIAEIFGCGIPTFYRWQHEHPEFQKAIKLGKAEPDNRVERSLYQRAVGYSHPDVHISNYQGEVTITPIMKHYPPDVAAAFIWLKNRRPELWRDKQEIEHTGTVEFAEALKVARERAGLVETSH
jgi:hypothetical protein